MIVKRLRLWIRDVFRRAAVEQELDEELQFHLACEVQRYLESGLSPKEARQRARAEFGGLDALDCQTKLLEERCGLAFRTRSFGCPVGPTAVS